MRLCRACQLGGLTTPLKLCKVVVDKGICVPCKSRKCSKQVCFAMANTSSGVVAEYTGS